MMSRSEFFILMLAIDFHDGDGVQFDRNPKNELYKQSVGAYIRQRPSLKGVNRGTALV